MKSFRNTTAALLAAGLLALSTQGIAANNRIDYQAEVPPGPKGPITFTPPAYEDIPDNEFGKVVRYGLDLYMNTDQLRGKYTGNGMKCVNCHLDAGRKADSAPAWAAYTMYPAYRKKNDRVNTMEERIAGCFRFSMNGTPPPTGSKEMTALVTYHYWLATGAPTGVALPGRLYPKLAKPEQKPDYNRGQKIYEANCAVCHGAKGEGQMVDGTYVFPPLWGKDSYNWGAGMHRVNTAAGFIKANMPLGQGNTLSDQEAWDVAQFVNGHERPADPRAKGKSVAENDKQFHGDGEQCVYGDKHDGHVMGTGAK